MKKTSVLFFVVLASMTMLFAHAPLLLVEDNGDGTIYIEGGFSNGEDAEGMPIIVVKNVPYNGPDETFKGKLIIFKCNLLEGASIIIPKPATKRYEVYFNGGEGHVKGVQGPALKKNEIKAWEKVIDEFDFGDWEDFMLEK